MPGSDKATLILSDGKPVDLQHLQTAVDSGLTVHNDSGLLKYQHPAAVHLHTVTTPRGGQYRILLSDRTKVWLNAASSLSYPTLFVAGKRIVSLSGEAYFEVSPSNARPFVVKTYRESMETTSGSFNVNCYPDEAVIKASVAKGSLHVHTYILQPGQGYAFGDQIATNTTEDIAWTRGQFGFDKTDIQVAMRQLSRWYDVEVSYPDGVPVMWITGQIPRNLKLPQLISALQSLGIHARFENGQLVILL